MSHISQINQTNPFDALLKVTSREWEREESKQKSFKEGYKKGYEEGYKKGCEDARSQGKSSFADDATTSFQRGASTSISWGTRTFSKEPELQQRPLSTIIKAIQDNSSVNRAASSLNTGANALRNFVGKLQLIDPSNKSILTCEKIHDMALEILIPIIETGGIPLP